MNAKPPLDHIKVLELGSTVAGPFCGRLLADFGAQVIKVEAPEGDPVRAMGSHVDGKSLYAASILRNKKLIALDLRKPEARELVAKLAAKVDVLVENFRPGTLEKWGLAPELLQRHNPGLIVVRISGFGQSGPYRDRPGYGFLGDAVGGLLHINGYPDRAPVRAGVPVTDMTTGLYAAFGTVMALLARQRTGAGQIVDAALYESAFSLMESHVSPYELLGKIATRAGSRLPGSTPNNLYPSKDGGHVALAAASDSVFQRLAKAMANPELARDPRFATSLARVRHQDELDALIADWTGQRDLAGLTALLQAHDVPAARIYTMADAFDDPHYAARGTIVRAPSPEFSQDIAMPAPVPRLSATPGQVRHAGGAVGQDTRAVLSEMLAISDEELAALLDCGAVFAAAVPADRP